MSLRLIIRKEMKKNCIENCFETEMFNSIKTFSNVKYKLCFSPKQSNITRERYNTFLKLDYPVDDLIVKQ